jgi:hypothetical protein
MSNETKINELEKMWNKFSDLIADNTPEFSWSDWIKYTQILHS